MRKRLEFETLATVSCPICEKKPVSGNRACVAAAGSQADYARRFESLPKGADLFRKDEVGKVILVARSGWACAYREGANGKRQILKIYLPGDIIGMETIMLQTAFYSVKALTPMSVCRLASSEYRRWLLASQEHTDKIFEELEKHCLDQSALIADLGTQRATERIRHFLSRIYLRLEGRITMRDNVFPLPLSQRDLADATGLTTIHVNRTIGELRDSGILDVGRGHVEILDRSKMMA